MKRAVKKILSAIIFCTILSILIMFTGSYLGPWDTSSDCWRYFYKEEKNSIDVLVLGSSAIYRYWIPPKAYEEQGFTSYMIAQAHQPIEAVPYIMEEALKTQDPDVIVVETRQDFINRADMNSGKYNQDQVTYYFSFVASSMRPSLTRTQMINHVLVEDESNTKLEWNIPLLKYHDNILKMNPQQLRQRLLLNKHPLKGTRAVEKVVCVDRADVTDASQYSLEEQDKKNIDLIVEKAKELGKEVVFVSTPYMTSEYRYPLQIQLDAYMAEKGYHYVNMQAMHEELGVNTQTDFFNRTHMNISGASKITSYLADYLVQNFSIRTDLSDSAKQEWDQALSNWKTEEKDLLEKWAVNCKKAEEKKIKEEEASDESDE